MITEFAPGKLVIAGEWAVLENALCIVAAIDKGVSAAIKESTDGQIHMETEGISATLDEAPSELGFVKAAIEVCLSYLPEHRPFTISTQGRGTVIEGKKIGFGSSAAATVAVVSGVLRFHEVTVSPELVFKLSAIAHHRVQGSGSGFDVAASSYGGVITYRRFDSAWLAGQEDVKKCVEQDWPGLSIERLQVPIGLELLVGWTGESASTADMIKKINSFRQKQPAVFSSVMQRIASVSEKLLSEWKAGDRIGILALISENETLLRELGEKSGVTIETAKLRKLSEIAEREGGAGKLSGAGGGDCGIAVCFDKETRRRIEKGWEEEKIMPVKALVHS